MTRVAPLIVVKFAERGKVQSCVTSQVIFRLSVMLRNFTISFPRGELRTPPYRTRTSLGHIWI